MAEHNNGVDYNVDDVVNALYGKLDGSPGELDGKTHILDGTAPVVNGAHAAPAAQQPETAEEDKLPLNRPNIRAVLTVELRISGVWECMRRLSYEAKEIEPTDEIPVRNRRMMEMGKYLEPMVKEFMREDGWEFVSEDTIVEIPHGRIILTGHPDGVVSHPLLTSGKAAIVEIKTRESGLAQFAWDFGVERSHPETVAQAAMYSMGLFDEAGDVFVATMSRDDGEMRVERIPAERVQIAYKNTMKRVAEIGKMAVRDEVPEPEFEQGNAKCMSCPFRTKCGNAEVPAQPGEGGLTDEEIELELKKWAEANKSAVKSSSPASKSKKAASDTLKAHMIAAGDYERDMVLGGVTYRMKLSESPGKEIDLEALNELVAPEIREQIVVEKLNRSFRVTTPKK